MSFRWRWSLVVTIFLLAGERSIVAQASTETYLDSVKAALEAKWPKNKTINLVFHGHSVPAGYAIQSVETFDSYPFQTLKDLKPFYPNAVINVIVTAIGGENSRRGSKRFADEVLNHRPDVLFIDYALNDRGIGLEESKLNMEKMVKAALEKNIKVMLLTPSPDQRVNLSQQDNELAQFAAQIRDIAEKYNIGLIDSYGAFMEQMNAGVPLKDLMWQVNHPNKRGHQLITNEIVEWFKKQ